MTAHNCIFFRLLYWKGNKTLTLHALFLKRRRLTILWCQYIYTICVFAWTDTGKDCDVKKVLFIAHLWHLSFLYLYRCQVKGLLIAGEKIIYLDNQIPSPHAIDMGGIVSLWYQKLLRCFKLRIHAMYMWKRKRQVGFIYPSSCTRLPNAHVYKLCRKFAQQWNERCIIILVPYFCTPQYSLYR